MGKEPTDEERRRYIELTFRKDRCEKEQAEYRELAKKVRVQIEPDHTALVGLLEMTTIQVHPEDKERFTTLCDGRTEPEGFTRLLDGKLLSQDINAGIACIIAEAIGLIPEGSDTDQATQIKMQVLLESLAYGARVKE